MKETKVEIILNKIESSEMYTWTQDEPLLITVMIMNFKRRQLTKGERQDRGRGLRGTNYHL